VKCLAERFIGFASFTRIVATSASCKLMRGNVAGMLNQNHRGRKILREACINRISVADRPWSGNHNYWNLDPHFGFLGCTWGPASGAHGIGPRLAPTRFAAILSLRSSSPDVYVLDLRSRVWYRNRWRPVRGAQRARGALRDSELHHNRRGFSV